MTDLFPATQRSAVSIGSNIHEGFGWQSGKPFIASMCNPHGSASELAFQLLLAQELRFGDGPRLREVLAQTVTIEKGLSLLITNQPSL